jgi:quinol monooxygenase YgiN/quercetin dioxygenase-like cupin family protein
MQTINRSLICLASLALATSALAQDPVPLYPDNYKILFENDRVRVLEFILRKGATEKFHHHPAVVTYVLSPFKIRFTFPDGTAKVREAKAGDVLFGEPVVHSPLNIGETDARGILVEMKSSSKEGASISADEQELLTALTFVRGPAASEEDLKRELLSTTAPTRAEPGNLKYDLYQSPNEKGSFLRLEVWRNAAALEEHKQTPPLQASFERRKSRGWTTEITTWKRMDDAVK